MMSEENREVRPWDFLKKNTQYVPKKIVNERMSICQQCENFFSLTKQCKICLCIMPAKTMLADAECPIKKWGKTHEHIEFDENEE